VEGDGVTWCTPIVTNRGADAERVSLVGAVAIGIGGMVGGGIFAVLGVAAENAGGATPIAFLVGGIVAALTAYSYSKLSVRYPSDGGTVTFIDQVFGVDVLTGSANVVLWVGYMATTALYAAAFGNYAASLLPGDVGSNEAVVRALVVLGVLVPWVINLASARLISRTEGAAVAVKLAILLLVIVAGVPSTESVRLSSDTWSSPVSIVAAGMLVFVAYEGFELISNASAEVVRPRRNLPLAFGLSVGVVAVLYVAIAAVVVGSLSTEEIRQASDYALAEAASATLGRVGFVLVGASALLATFSALNATLYGAARLSFTLAIEGELPSGFRRRPWHQPIGLHVTAVVGTALAVGVRLDAISSLASTIFLVVFTAVNLAAARAGRGARVNRAVAMLGASASAAACLVLMVRSVRDQPIAVVLFVGLVGVALVVEHRVLGPRRRGRAVGTPAT
jgi:amino acid transporter